MRSISSAEAIPSASMPLQLHVMLGISILFTTNPGASSTSTGSLPKSFKDNSIIAFFGFLLEVAIPFMISTNFHYWHRIEEMHSYYLTQALLVALAISVIDKDEVLVLE